MIDLAHRFKALSGATDPILGEACIDGSPDLLEIDGEDATC